MNKPQDYKYIWAWGKLLMSFDYYIEMEQQKAAEDKAPLTAVYKKDDKWQTFEEIESVATKERLMEIVKDYNDTIIRKDMTKLLRDSDYSVDDAHSAIEFAMDLLSIHIKDCELNYPDATRSMAEMRQAVSRVSDLRDFLEEYYGD